MHCIDTNLQPALKPSTGALSQPLNSATRVAIVGRLPTTGGETCSLHSRSNVGKHVSLWLLGDCCCWRVPNNTKTPIFHTRGVAFTVHPGLCVALSAFSFVPEWLLRAAVSV